MAPTRLTTRGLVDTGYEELSFIVTEVSSDGWLHVRYAATSGDDDLAWTPGCALEEEPVRLNVTEWSDWFFTEYWSGAISPMFFRVEETGSLHSGPSSDATLMPAIGDDYVLEPLEVRGEWMGVTVKEPSDYCEFDLTVQSRNGWVRWYADGRGPLLWYFTRGC